MAVLHVLLLSSSLLLQLCCALFCTVFVGIGAACCFCLCFEVRSYGFGV